MKRNCKIVILIITLLVGFVGENSILYANGVDVEKQKKEKKDFVTAQIVGEEGRGVDDAVICVKGTSRKVKTKKNGRFMIKADMNDVLIITAPVRISREIPVQEILRQGKIKLKWQQSDSDEVFVFVDKRPEFQYGSFVDWIKNNMRYPLPAQRDKVEGRVLVSFIVEKDGRLTNIRVLTKDIHISLQEEARRVIASMPNWQPGIKKGKTVRVRLTIPVTFSLH